MSCSESVRQEIALHLMMQEMDERKIPHHVLVEFQHMENEKCLVAKRLNIIIVKLKPFNVNMKILVCKLKFTLPTQVAAILSSWAIARRVVSNAESSSSTLKIEQATQPSC